MAEGRNAYVLLRAHRRLAGTVLFVLAALMLAFLPIVVTASPAGWSGAVFASLRLTALYAFTLIFMNIVTGALAPWFYAVFGARKESVIHLVTGLAGFTLALAHGLIVLTQRYYRGYSAAWLIGPVTLGLLVLTVWVALDRKRMKKAWRVIHQMNYAIFAVIYIKAVIIGSDLKGSSRAGVTTLIVFTLYAVIAALALATRIRRFVAVERRRKAAPA
ncbi:MAG: hypothetical protein KKF41_06255 [Actinobacteria bacterium]|nr:hypothetical protein [Actinomycetota bacterium]MBU1942062.1 hypothetical protein [Actinomycetota bacterium]MBU2687167.1 hypothetical protein [Actinomycetota bacterium]